jgi:DNA-binding IscR family transcriptional regulator
MIVTPKTRYTLRAVFGLARKWDQGPVKIVEIAKRQGHPAAVPGGHPFPAQADRDR